MTRLIIAATAWSLGTTVISALGMRDAHDCSQLGATIVVALFWPVVLVAAVPVVVGMYIGNLFRRRT